MKKHTLSKLLIGCSAMIFAFACQPNKPMTPSAPPVAPPQSYESEDCTDPDECSSGAASEAPKSEQAPVQTVESTPAPEAVAPAVVPEVVETPAPAAEVVPAETVATPVAEESIQVECVPETAATSDPEFSSEQE